MFRRKRDEQSHAYSKIFPSFIIFFFLELDQINIQLFYSYSYIAELSSSLSPIFIYCAKTGVSNQSLNKGGVKIKWHKRFNMKYSHLLPHICCTLMTTLLMVSFTPRKGKLNGKILLHVFFSQVLDGAHCVCALMVAILHTQTFILFDFDPSLISRLATDSVLDQIS